MVEIIKVGNSLRGPERNATEDGEAYLHIGYSSLTGPDRNVTEDSLL